MKGSAGYHGRLFMLAIRASLRTAITESLIRVLIGGKYVSGDRLKLIVDYCQIKESFTIDQVFGLDYVYHLQLKTV